MTSVAPPALVMHVIHHLRMGGLENGLVNLINRLNPREWRHVIVCVEDADDFRLRIQRADVAVHSLHRSHIGVWALRRRLLALCRELQPAILHSRNLSGLDAVWPAWLAGVRHRVHGEHGWDMHDLHGQSSRSRWLRRLHAPWIGQWVTVSQHLRDYLIQQIGVRENAVEWIGNGVDTDRFRPPRDGDRFELPIGFEGPDRIRFGTVGRCQAVKDQATLIEAFARMLQRRPDLRTSARLVVAGDGPLHADLRSKAAALGVQDQCWLPGARDDVPELLRSLDVFVLPSLNEGISNTLLEAMASGLPLLASRAGGNPELVLPEVNGALFEPGDVDKLTDLMIRLASHPDLRRKQAAAARSIAVERFGLAAMVSAYGSMYRRMVT